MDCRKLSLVKIVLVYVIVYFMDFMIFWKCFKSIRYIGCKYMYCLVGGCLFLNNFCYCRMFWQLIFVFLGGGGGFFGFFNVKFLRCLQEYMMFFM